MQHTRRQEQPQLTSTSWSIEPCCGGAVESCIVGANERFEAGPMSHATPETPEVYNRVEARDRAAAAAAAPEEFSGIQAEFPSFCHVDFAAAVVSREPLRVMRMRWSDRRGQRDECTNASRIFSRSVSQNSPKDFEFRRADPANLILTPPKTAFYLLFTGRGKTGVTKGVETATGFFGR